MSVATANPATRDPTTRDRDTAAHDDHDRKTEPSRIWVLLEALAYAGAYIDPTGVLAAQRFSRVREEHQRRGRR
jgi:hypothetical protein